MSMTGGEYLARTLHGYGVTHVFFMDAILRHTLAHLEPLGVKRILAHSEKAAAYMADGYARASCRVAVCMAQSVGAANLAAGLQDARLAHSPVIALTGRHIAANQYRNAYQELPHEPMYAAVSKGSFRIEAPSQLSTLLPQAFRLASTGAPGPVHLDVAGNVGSVFDNWQVEGEPVTEPLYGEVPPQRPRPQPERLREAAALLAAAERPVMLIGMGVHWSDAGEQVRRLAARCDIPVVGTLDVKSVMAALPALDGGVAGTYGTDAGNHLLAEADTVLVVGCDTGDQALGNWTLPSASAHCIQIDIDPAELGLNLPGAVGLHADPRDGLEALAQELEDRRRPAWLQRLEALKRAWWDVHGPALRQTRRPLHPAQLCEVLGRWLPEDAILVTDTGYASQWSGQMLSLRHHGQTFLRAAGSLGWGFPASLGAKAARPERPVVCLTGDGGFMYHLPELETAARWGLNTITVVNNNGCLAQGLRNLRLAQIEGGQRMTDCFQFLQQDYAAIARSFGCVGLSAETPEELAQALEQAGRADSPVVIDVRTDPEALAPIPWMPESRA